MSEPKPESKDRTALYIAIVGATATIVAALVGILPNLLNRSAPPTLLVITATPPLTIIAQATTTIPPTLTNVPPTTVPTTTNPPPTLAPTATNAPSPTASVQRIDFLVTNNRTDALDFYIDDEFQVTVPAGGYQLMRVIPGERRLTHCPRNAKPSDAASGCETLTREVKNNPYDWELGGTVPAPREVLLFMLNQIDNDVDIFIDGSTKVSVNAHKMGTTQLVPGAHEIQTCLRGTNPSQGVCGTANRFELLRKVEMFLVNLP